MIYLIWKLRRKQYDDPGGEKPKRAESLSKAEWRDDIETVAKGRIQHFFPPQIPKIY